MRKIIKKMLGVTLSTTTILTSFAPLTVLANSPYTVTFTFADGYNGTTTGGNGKNFVIGANYTELRTNKDENDSVVGTANCSNDTCTITVEDGTPSYLISGPFTFKQGNEVFDINSPISSNITLHVEAQQQNQQQPQQPIDNNYNVTFNGTVSGGNVTYTIGDATVTVSVTGKSIPASKTLEVSAIDTITLSGFDADTMQVRVSDNDPNQQNPFGMNLTVDNNVVHIVNPNGGMPPSLDFVVEAKNNNNNNNNNNNDPQTQQPVTGDHFDGRAYLVWSCKNGGVCYSEFTDIPSFDDGNSTFYKASDIIDSRTGEQFDVSANKKFFTPKELFDEWVTNNSPVDFSKLDINKLIGENGIDYQPLGEPEYDNAYVSYGDRNFKVVVYNDNYKGISIGDLTELSYYPSSWKNPFLRRDQFDISNTTIFKPAVIDAILLEKTLNIKALDYNGFEITKLEAIDVPSNAVSITKVNNEWKLVFSSNFYDNVLFKATDNKGETSYFRIKRYTIDGWINNIDNKPYIYAEYFYDRSKSYSDFEMTAKIEYKNGKTKNIKLTPYKGIDDGLGNITDAYEADEEHPKFGPSGKGLKKALFVYKLQDDEAKTIKNIYFNLEYKGSTSSSYAGAFAGSGKGVLANLYQGEE